MAEDKLADFYDGIEFEELLLNSGQGQRVILVAAQFRKEVTSTALWLRSHRIDISCILATPYVLSGSLLLNLNQIIPVKEAEEYMIMVSEKEGEERDDRADRPNRMNVRYAFWEQFLPILQSGGVTLFSSVTPTDKSSLREQLPVRGVFVALDFKRHGLEVRLVFRGKFGLAAYKKFDLTGFRSQVDMEVEDADVRGNVHKLSIKHSVNAFDETRWPECNAWLLSTLKKVLGAAKISLPELDIALP